MKSDTVGGKAASNACNTHCLLGTSLLAFTARACLCQCDNVHGTRGVLVTSSISLQHQRKETADVY